MKQKIATAGKFCWILQLCFTATGSSFLFGFGTMRESYSEAEIVYVEHPSNPKFKDLTARDFGRWSVIGFAGVENNKSLWWCFCECGTIRKVNGYDLAVGKTTSCGCLQSEQLAKSNTKHGECKKSYLYTLWCGIKDRTSNSNNAGYQNYGARGIQLHPAWQDDYQAFAAWIRANLGERPDNYSLDRVNNDGPYAPGNLRWADRRTQRLNQRHDRRKAIFIDGEPLVYVAERANLNYAMLRSRVYYGWCNACLTKPLNSTCEHRGKV